MFAHAIAGAIGGGRRRMTVVIAAALVLALHIALLFLIAMGAGGMVIKTGMAIGEAAGPFFAGALLLALLGSMRVLLRRADALACRVLS